MSFQKAVEEVPSKFITVEVEVQLACRLLYVDMEGLNDGRAVKSIVPQVNPRKMVRPQHEARDLFLSFLDPRQRQHRIHRIPHRKLRKHSIHDQRHLCSSRGRERSNWSTDQQLLDFRQR